MTEPIAVIFLTYERTDYALCTIRAAKQYLKYPELLWYLADDGSRREHIDAVKAELNGTPGIGWHSLPGGTYGANANTAYREAQKHADLTFWLEDDFELRQELDLEPYARLLQERQDIGMVRLGYLNLHMKGTVFGHGGHLYWLLDRKADPYVFTGHPSLRHKRFMETYGPYQEGLTPGQTELSYATKHYLGQGPDIVWPVALGEYGPFGHIGTIQSY